MASKLKLLVENLTNTFLIIREADGSTVKIPPRGEVEVAGLTEALKRLDEAECPLIKIKMPRKPGPVSREAKAFLTSDDPEVAADESSEESDSTGVDKAAKKGGK